jgi:hypothetical protein
LPLQNRITPFGELLATACRGTLMGNRGCLHDEQRQIRRSFACRRWILCLLAFRGRRRPVMTPGRYTELFFLDEATGLAAGHRPCWECQRTRYHLFREHWAAANPELAGSVVPAADALDQVLHAERLEGRRAKRTYRERLSQLPEGVMVADDEDRAYLVWQGALLPWTPAGYGPRVPGPTETALRVLTPRSVVQAIRHGFPVGAHPSANGCQ